MNSVALIANSSEWITSQNKIFGGGNVVSYNIYRVLKQKNIHITIICSGNREDYNSENLTVKYINHPIGSLEFTQKALEEGKKCDKIINFMTQNIFDGVIIQSHSFLYRTTRTAKVLIPLKRFLYRKKIDYQKRLYSSPLNYAYAVSKGIKKDFESNFGIKNIIVSYPGCKRIYEQFKDNSNEVLTFGLIANSSLNKGGNYCILALWFSKILGLNFKFKLIAPKYKKDILMRFLLNISGLKKQTQIFPKQDDMTEFYKSIDCVIMPSIHESFGLVPLEAMSFCKTCLVSDNIGFAELIDEKSGFKFNRLSFISFIKSILNLGKMFYNDKTQFNEIRKRGWKISLSHSWEDFVEGLLK